MSVRRIDWPWAVALYKSGCGTKAIAKTLGCNQSSVRQGLLKCGVYQLGRMQKANRAGPWVGRGKELDAANAIWREHDRWWTKAFKPSREQLNAKSLAHYYSNHSINKAKNAACAKARYARLKNTPYYKTKQFARNQLARIRRQAHGWAKNGRTIQYLGCTYQHAVDWITRQLPHEWTWENYGVVWEIDHLIQLSDGLLTDGAHLTRICHYTNLRPLSVRDNRSRIKGVWARRQIAA